MIWMINRCNQAMRRNKEALDRLNEKIDIQNMMTKSTVGKIGVVALPLKNPKNLLELEREVRNNQEQLDLLVSVQLIKSI